MLVDCWGRSVMGLAWMVMATGLLVLCEVQPATAAGNETDDGWRRTVDGWERKETWNLNAVPEESLVRLTSVASPIRKEVAKSLPRIDFHPAILAFLQVLLTAAGFAMWPLGMISRSRTNSLSGVKSAVSSSPMIVRAA